MPINKINQSLTQNAYFITPTIWNWYYIFDRHKRWEIIADSLKFCQRNKELEIYSYVFMLNHLHLIVKSPDVVGFLRDFKKFTSRKLIENIAKTESQVLELFKTEFSEIFNISPVSFWLVSISFILFTLAGKNVCQEA